MSKHSRARVNATLSLRSSSRNPSCLVRVHEMTTMSASWPWNPSTVPTRTETSSTCLTIKSRCSRYGVITATDAPLRAHCRAALTTVATTVASDAFMMDLDAAPTPSSP